MSVREQKIEGPQGSGHATNESSVRSKARLEVLARRPVGVEAGVRDAAASRAGLRIYRLRRTLSLFLSAIPPHPGTLVTG